ncbi:AMP-dependent synthetase/ligase [Rhodococcus zopfii]|uniref:AMP-dependent synthetase/ligase n=1 Tax=Rhodococcus zopfii TaxID=43772 RepID=UPI00111111B5|nr:AMP-binding protein [Rhodococcus zopfii]
MVSAARDDAAPDTVPRLLFDRVAHTPDGEAYRFPDTDGWASVTWSEVGSRVTTLAAGLIARGVAPGARVAIRAATGYRAILADFAVACAGAVSVPMYAPTRDEEVARLVRHCDAVLTVTDRGADDQALHLDGLADLAADGDRLLATEPDAVESRIAEVTPDSPACLIYTARDDGTAKGATLSHGAVAYVARAMAELGMIGPRDVQLLWLPLSHVFGRGLLFAAVRVGLPTAVDGRADRVVENLRSVRPTFLGSVPHVLEKIGVAAAADPAALGGRLRFLISGSARLARVLADRFDNLGVSVFEGYGITETAGPACVNRPDAHNPGSVGLPLPGTEIRVADDGELLIRSPAVMTGYHADPAATATALDHGWFHTGDCATIDADGFVSMCGRKKDVFKTTTGKYVAPNAIAARFRALCPGAEIVVAGEGRSHCVGLVFPGGDDADVQSAVEQLNSELNRWERIRRVAIVDRPLGDDDRDGNGVPRRARILERFAKAIDRLYDDQR